MPTTAVPVPPFARIGAGDDDLVTLTRADLVIAAGAAVGLDGLVRLHVPDVDRIRVVVGEAMFGHRGIAAHSTSRSTTTTAMATSAMSLRRCTRRPNGLKPTGR